jgi:hypothetical protein
VTPHRLDHEKYFSQNLVTIERLICPTCAPCYEDLTKQVDEREIPPSFKGNGDTLSMSNDAPSLTSPHAATGMAGGARPAFMMITIITTRMRGGIG